MPSRRYNKRSRHSGVGNAGLVVEVIRKGAAIRVVGTREPEAILEAGAWDAAEWAAAQAVAAWEIRG
jgi:hypothetical protein